jgi:hypothetical protein
MSFRYSRIGHKVYPLLLHSVFGVRRGFSLDNSFALEYPDQVHRSNVMICMGVLRPWQFRNGATSAADGYLYSWTGLVLTTLGVTMLPHPVSVPPVPCYSSVKGSASVSSTSGMVGLLCRISAGIERHISLSRRV